MTTVLAVISAMGTLIPLIMELMKSVEADMGTGTGADKKAAVLSGVQAVVGDPTIWTKVQGFMGTLIDVLAKFHFGAKS